MSPSNCQQAGQDKYLSLACLMISSSFGFSKPNTVMSLKTSSVSSLTIRAGGMLLNIGPVWLNGGPGCSSLTGLAYENGPLKFYARSAVPTLNNASWTRLAHVLYIDQPVGTGYSSGDQAAINIADNTYDLFHWLKAFYDRFPNLRNKKTYLMGESYAGIYVSHKTT